MSRPLLLACTQVYPGPWVPTSGLAGGIKVEGLVHGLDEVVIRVRDITESEEDTVIIIDRDMEMRIDLKGTLVRAERTKSSGKEVSVWLS